MATAAWHIKLLLAASCWQVALHENPCTPKQPGNPCGCDESRLKLQADSSEEHIGQDSEYYYVDDMAFLRPRHTQSDFSSKFSSGGLNIAFWPGGIIFYLIDDSFGNDFKKKIKLALSTIQKEVGQQHLEFREARTASGEICRKSYLSIEKKEEKKCESMVGMSNDMNNPLTKTWLNEDLCSQGTVVHELLHALGRIHEQCRPDRDKHVVLMPKNILSHACNNFAMSGRSPDEDQTLRLPYDINSIMHYESCAFNCYGEYSMVALDGSKIELNREKMTDLDIQKMRVMYPANAKIPYIDAYCSSCRTGQLCSALGVTLGLIFYVTAVRCQW